MIHRTPAGIRGTAADIEIHAKEFLSITRRMEEILTKHTGHPFEKMMLDTDRDRFMPPKKPLDTA